MLKMKVVKLTWKIIYSTQFLTLILNVHMFIFHLNSHLSSKTMKYAPETRVRWVQEFLDPVDQFFSVWSF
jgi:hypothetical protein